MYKLYYINNINREPYYVLLYYILRVTSELTSEMFSYEMKFQVSDCGKLVKILIIS